MNNRNYQTLSPKFGRIVDALRNGHSVEAVAKNFDGVYWDIGGGCFIAQITDIDGTVIGATDEVVVRYPADQFIDPDYEIETEFLDCNPSTMYVLE